MVNNKIDWELYSLLKKKNFTKKGFSEALVKVNAGFTDARITDALTANPRKVDLNILAAMTEVLNCKVEDLLKLKSKSNFFDGNYSDLAKCEDGYFLLEIPSENSIQHDLLALEMNKIGTAKSKLFEVVELVKIKDRNKIVSIILSNIKRNKIRIIKNRAGDNSNPKDIFIYKSGHKFILSFKIISLKMKCKHSVTTLLLLANYTDFHNKSIKTDWFQVDKLSILFGRPGIEFSVFNKQVLQKAILEIKTILNINVGIETLREGHMIKYLRLTIN